MAHVLPTELLRTCDDGLLYCFSSWANNITFGMWWVMLLLGFCFALFMATIQMGTQRAFGYASVVGLFGAVWLAILGLMTWWIASAFILTGVIGTVMMLMADR